jgi:hypothetical protein
LLPSALAPDVIDRAGGNPLFAEESVRLLRDRGTGPTVAGLASALREPRTIDSIIAERLDLLSADLKELLQDAAVVGKVFSVSALAGTLDRSEGRVRRGLADLVVRGFIEALAEPASDADVYSFRHATIRDVAYGQIPRLARASKHAIVAAWLEATSSERIGDQAEPVSEHYVAALALHDAAGRPDGVEPLLEGALRSTLLAGERNVRVDPDRAHRSLSRSADLLSRWSRDGAYGAGSTHPLRFGVLGNSLGAWQTTVEILQRFADAGDPGVLRELGVAMCKLHADDPRGDGYLAGQRHLQDAASSGTDADALSALAGTWKRIDDERARGLYREAVALDATDPYALGNLLELEVEASGDLSAVGAMASSIEASLARCREDVLALRNLPWVHYDIGKFTFLLDRPRESFRAYAKAIQSSSAPHMIETALRSHERLEVVRDALPGWEEVRRILVTGLAARFPGADTLGAILEMTTSGARPLWAPIVVVAGSSSGEPVGALDGYRNVLIDAFEAAQRIAVSGGTVQGVSRVIGDVRERVGTRMRSIGYVPRRMPADVTVDRNPDRYDEIRETDGEGFSVVEHLQMWADVLSSGCSIADTTVLGFGGGTVTADELRIALAFGARVGVIAGGGGAGDGLLADGEWAGAPNLVILNEEPGTVRGFLSV